MIDDSFLEWGKEKLIRRWRVQGFLVQSTILQLVMGMHDSYKQHEHLRFLFFHPNLNPQGDFSCFGA